MARIPSSQMSPVHPEAGPITFRSDAGSPCAWLAETESETVATRCGRKVACQEGRAGRLEPWDTAE